MVQFSAAVSAAHKAKDMDQVAYEESCSRCQDIFKTKGSVSGCRHHAGRGRLSRLGNARFAQDYINCMSRIKKRNLAGYVPSPESMCNPLELQPPLQNTVTASEHLFSSQCDQRFAVFKSTATAKWTNL
ncbi:hypothetical protein H257_07898 [Aphanomyces astaci]|uniref:Uncharacterized protein n=1 Tax=Aphanomyces astaci TaxID=112090 RepID=W4GF37_APHAT|nr:hypothetical protein H257_07898 [Aphanomyces astaci]ETV78312.1 hypothetical protein H257_07898 [Aphanomyces astaci]|eukprot:XP_009831893.1 hypothetical protein H257_07898 [Aphanomyces astaci]